MKKIDPWLEYIKDLRGRMITKIGAEAARHYPLNLTEAAKLFKAKVPTDFAWSGFIKDKSAEQIIQHHKLNKAFV